jgi:hypothetical protein
MPEQQKKGHGRRWEAGGQEGEGYGEYRTDIFHVEGIEDIY